MVCNVKAIGRKQGLVSPKLHTVWWGRQISSKKGHQETNFVSTRLPLGDAGDVHNVFDCDQSRDVQTHAKKSKAEVRTSETFRQLRQAVLSSLDFSDSAQSDPEWDNLEHDMSWEDIGPASTGSADAVGRAMYEVCCCWGAWPMCFSTEQSVLVHQ